MIWSMDSSSSCVRIELEALYTIELIMDMFSTLIFAAAEKLLREQMRWEATPALVFNHSSVPLPELSMSYTS